MGTEYSKDVEAASTRNEQYTDIENEPLLPSKSSDGPTSSNSPSKARFSYPHIVGSFLLGILVQYAVSKCSSGSLSTSFSSSDSLVSPSYETNFVPPYVGSTEVHQYPPAKPTNVDPSLFPSNIGYAGPTPTGAEPALLATAPVNPAHSGAPGLLAPPALASGKTKSGEPFDLFRHWGNLSPWYTNEKGAFGVDSGPEAPAGCSITGLHLLHRHGARYPTGWGVYYF
jgi:hypothetical protein